MKEKIEIDREEYEAEIEGFETGIEKHKEKISRLYEKLEKDVAKQKKSFEEGGYYCPERLKILAEEIAEQKEEIKNLHLQKMLLKQIVKN